MCNNNNNINNKNKTKTKQKKKKKRNKTKQNKTRSVGTKLVLVRRIKSNNLLSMKAERAKRVERLTAWGPGAR